MCVAKMTGEGQPMDRHVANPVAAFATPKQLSRLERVVLEIVETEQAYVRDLKSIVEVSKLRYNSNTSKEESPFDFLYVFVGIN